MKFNLAYIGASVATVLLLSACGGGGGDSDVEIETPATPEEPVSTEITVDEGFVQYLTDLSTNVIIPSYTELNTEAQTLVDGSQTFCSLTSASQTDLDTLRSQWAATNLAWQSIQWVGVGGIASGINPIDFRLQFFPDTSGVVTRAVDDLLIDPNVITADFVATQNVGGQGLPALELLMYPDDTDNSLLSASDADKRCEVLQAIAQNVENMTFEVLNSWLPSGEDFQQELISGTGEFTSVRDAVEELVTNFLEHAEVVKDEKMLFPLGTTSPGIIELSEYFRSDESLNSIIANITAMSTLFSNSDDSGIDGLGFDDILTDIVDQEDVSVLMQTAIDTALTNVETLNSSFDSFEDALASEDGRAQVNVIIEDLRVLRDLISIEFIQALDISIGFNSNDGD